MQVLRAALRVAAPWKNGGGVTREIAASPPGAGFDDFRWRVSMAEVRSDGPFSLFPEVDRILAVIEGRLALSVADGGAFDLSPASPPAAFPGDAAATGRVVGGPVLDLNVMTRRGAATGALERLEIDRPVALGAFAGERVVVVASGPLLAVAGGPPLSLARFDALLLEPGETVALEAARPATAYLAAFS